DHPLAESLLVAATDEPDGPGAGLEALLALANPVGAASLGVQLQALAADATPATTRDLIVGSTRPNRPFRLGDRVRFSFWTAIACHVALLDIGTTGTVSVILPNRWRVHGRAEGGRVHEVPSRATPEFEFTLGGPPGRERVLAIATLHEPPVPLQPEEGSPFRTLSPAEID